MRVVLVLALSGSRRAGAFLGHAAVGRVRLVVCVAGFVAGLVVRVTVLVVIVFASMSVISALAVMAVTRFAVLLVIGQFADFVTFAGPEEREGGRRCNGDRIAEK